MHANVSKSTWHRHGLDWIVVGLLGGCWTEAKVPSATPDLETDQHAPCIAPLITTGAELGQTAAERGEIWSAALIGQGDRAAVVYAVHRDDSRRVAYRLQRLAADGTKRGPVVPLGDANMIVDPTLTGASDRDRFVVCWDLQTESGGGDRRVDCVSVPSTEGGPSPWFSAAGSSPSIAASEGVWAIAYGATRPTGVRKR